MRAVEASSRNEAVIQQAQNEVRSAQASIKFLEDELSKLQLGSGGANMPPPAPSPRGPQPGVGYGPGQGQPGPPGQGYAGPGGPMTPTKNAQMPGNQVISPSPSRQGDRERPLPPPPAGEEPRRPDQKNYTQLGELSYPVFVGIALGLADSLDLLRYDAPLTGAKITRMLNQLQFKLQVEEQYKLGIEKMAQAYRAEGDKRLRSETESKRIESDGKIQLLRKAKRRYETLAKFGGAVEDDEGEFPGADHGDCISFCAARS